MREGEKERRGEGEKGRRGRKGEWGRKSESYSEIDYHLLPNTRQLLVLLPAVCCLILPKKIRDRHI